MTHAQQPSLASDAAIDQATLAEIQQVNLHGQVCMATGDEFGVAMLILAAMLAALVLVMWNFADREAGRE